MGKSFPPKHMLPIDHSLHGAEIGVPEVRSVVHLHGAKTSPENDGYPEDWYVPGKARTDYYPNEQRAPRFSGTTITRWHPIA